MSLGDYCIKVNSNIKALKKRYDVTDLDIAALRHHFGWAGHVSRVSQADDNRLVGNILHFRILFGSV